MSEAPKNWRIADGIIPKPQWDRPKRIDLVSKSLAAGGASDVRVYLGGERFTFSHKNAFVVLDIFTGRKHANICAKVYAGGEAYARGEQRETVNEFADETEEKIDEGVKRLIDKI